MGSKLCSSKNGASWTCTDVSDAGDLGPVSFHRCGSLLYRFSSVSVPTPTGELTKTRVVTYDDGAPSKMFYISKPYNFSACFGKNVAFYGNGNVISLAHLGSNRIEMEKIPGVMLVMGAAGGVHVGLFVVAMSDGPSRLLEYRDGSYKFLETPFKPRHVAYSGGVFLVTTNQKMYISKNLEDWKMVS